MKPENDLFCVGLVLWHINYCSLFNAKFFVLLYIKHEISKKKFVDSISKQAWVYF